MTLLLLGLALLRPAHAAPASATFQLELLGRYSTGLFDQGAAEIPAYDPATARLFVVNAAASGVDILDISDPSAPIHMGVIDVTAWGAQANSVSLHDGILAVAVEGHVRTDPGFVVFYDAGGAELAAVQVGALPDMVAFSPNGQEVVVACEGEPSADGLIDPQGSVAIVDLRGGHASLGPADVTLLGFAGWEGLPLDESLRNQGVTASLSANLEPEYVAISHDSKTAWVTLQENNGVAIIDLQARELIDLVGLGYKNHALADQGFDASDRDGGIFIAPWPVLGMYQPDAIASFRVGGQDYLWLANEGEARETPGAAEETRVAAAGLDPAIFPPSSSLTSNARLGRLTVDKVAGNLDSDPELEVLYAFGARSVSVRAADGSLLWDSGNDIEQITAAAAPAGFNASHDSNTRDTRSDNKGPEPEGVAVGKVQGVTLGFVGLERVGGLLVYDLSDPAAPAFQSYASSRDFSGDPALGTAGDLGPEGLLFISAVDSPTGEALLVVSYEVSGTTSIYGVGRAP